MKKAIVCLGLGIAAVESNQDFLSGILGNDCGTTNGSRSGVAYASSNASNTSSSYATTGGIKANNINTLDLSGAKTGNKVSSNSSTTTYQKADVNLNNSNTVQSGNCGDDLSFSNDYGCNDNCSDSKYAVNLPYDNCYGGNAIEEGCGSNNGNTFGVQSTDFGNFANYGVNNDNCYADEDHFGKASNLAQSALKGNELGGLVLGGNTVASSQAVSNTSATAVSNNNACAPTTAPVVIQQPRVTQAAPVIMQAPVVQQAPQYVAQPVVVQQAPQYVAQPVIVQQAPQVVAQPVNNANEVSINQTTGAAENNQSAAAYNKQAAIYQVGANQAAIGSTEQNAKYNKSATTSDNAANSQGKNIRTSNDVLTSNSGLCYKNGGNLKKNLDKDHICHANDQALHKEEHCADEQRFQSDDTGKVKTLECTHIVECVVKDCDKGESAKRQIWTKKKSCAKKCNDKRACNKNIHKACHKNTDKQAYKQAAHQLNICNNHDVDHNASCNDSKCADEGYGSTNVSGSSDQYGASSNDAYSDKTVKQGSSANSYGNAGSSSDIGRTGSVSQKVAGVGKSYNTNAVDSC